MTTAIKPENIGFLCGFAMEADVARKTSPHVAMSGAREELAYARAEALAKNGAQALVSFGVAGALSDAVPLDAVIIPSAIKASDNRSWACDEALAARLRRGAAQAQSGAVYGSRVLVPGPREKKTIHDATGCTIVDMESHIVAEVATRHGLPFAVLRGVSDGVNDVFPDAAFRGLNPDGSTNTAAVLFSLACNPFQLPALKKLFAHTGAALQRLESTLSKI